MGRRSPKRSFQRPRPFLGRIVFLLLLLRYIICPRVVPDQTQGRPQTSQALYMSRHNPSLLHNPGTSFLCIFYHGNFIVFEKLGASVWLPCFTEGWRCPFTAGEGTQNPQAGWASAQLLSYPSSWKRPSHVLLACFSHSVLVGNFWRIRLHLYWITQVWMLPRFSFELQNYTSCLWRE